MKKEARPGRHRLSMDILNGIQERIQAAATKRNITVTKWITRAIIRALIEEEKYNTPPPFTSSDK